MGRRSTFSVGKRGIGAPQVEAALAKVIELQQLAVFTLEPYPFEPQETLSLLFPPDVREIAAVAHKVVHTPHCTVNYTLPGKTSSLSVDFSGSGLAPIDPHRLNVLPPLVDYVDRVRVIHEQYERVKQVIKWLNEYCSPSGVRYYWPQIMQLVNCPAVAEIKASETNHQVPVGLGDMLQIIRDTAATVAGSALMPFVKTPDRNSLWLNFGTYILDAGSPSAYRTAIITYNL